MRRLFNLLLLLLMGVAFSNQSSALTNMVDTGHQYDVNHIALGEKIYGYDTISNPRHSHLTSTAVKVQDRSFLAIVSSFIVTKGTSPNVKKVLDGIEQNGFKEKR